MKSLFITAGILPETALGSIGGPDRDGPGLHPGLAAYRKDVRSNRTALSPAVRQTRIIRFRLLRARRLDYWPVTLKTILDVSYRNEAGRPPPNPFVAAAPQGRLSSSLVREGSPAIPISMLQPTGVVSIRPTQHLEIRREGGEQSAGENQMGLKIGIMGVGALGGYAGAHMAQ